MYERKLTQITFEHSTLTMYSEEINGKTHLEFYIVDVSLMVVLMTKKKKNSGIDELILKLFYMYHMIVQMSNILMFCGTKFLTLEREIKI